VVADSRVHRFLWASLRVGIDAHFRFIRPVRLVENALIAVVARFYELIAQFGPLSGSPLHLRSQLAAVSWAPWAYAQPATLTSVKIDNDYSHLDQRRDGGAMSLIPLATIDRDALSAANKSLLFISLRHDTRRPRR